MIADVADYSEWKTSRRATGFMFAGILFALKAGLSLGGALSAWIIDAYGTCRTWRRPSARFWHPPRRQRVSGNRTGFVLLCLAVYPIGKTLNLRIQEELVARRRSYSPWRCHSERRGSAAPVPGSHAHSGRADRGPPRR